MTDKHTPGTCPDLIQCQAFYDAVKDRNWINYCPTHALAPEMAVQLDRLLEQVESLYKALGSNVAKYGDAQDEIDNTVLLLSRINSKGGE